MADALDALDARLAAIEAELLSLAEGQKLIALMEDRVAKMLGMHQQALESYEKRLDKLEGKENA